MTIWTEGYRATVLGRPYRVATCPSCGERMLVPEECRCADPVFGPLCWDCDDPQWRRQDPHGDAYSHRSDVAYHGLHRPGDC